MMDSLDVKSDEARTRKDSDSSLPPPRKDSNSSTSSMFSFKSMFGRHDSGISTASSSVSSSEHAELESNLSTSLNKNSLSEDSEFSVDLIQNLNSLDSRRRSSGSTMSLLKRSDSAESNFSRRASEISLPTVTEDEESEVGDDDWKRKASLSSYSLSSTPSFASIEPTDNPTPPATPIIREEQRTRRVKSKSLDSTEIADKVSSRVRKLSMSSFLESSLNKFKNMKDDVLESFRRVYEENLDTPIVMPSVRIKC